MYRCSSTLVDPGSRLDVPHEHCFITDPPTSRLRLIQNRVDFRASDSLEAWYPLIQLYPAQWPQAGDAVSVFSADELAVVLCHYTSTP